MKKLLAIIMAGAMLFAMTACAPAEEPEPESIPREAITPAPASVLVGNYTLSAEYLPFETPAIYDGSDDPDMDVLGNTVYVSNGTEIKLYTLDGSALTYSKTIEAEAGDSISVDANGKIYMDGGVFEAKILDPATGATGEAVASGELTMAKTADFGLAYFTGRENVTAIKNGVAAPWTINGVADTGKFESINTIEIVGDTVLLAGADAENNVIGAYDMDGNQLMLSSGCLAGSLPNAATKTANGYVASSVNKMTFVNNDGAIIGEVDAKELLGIPDDSVWIYEMTALPDGGFLVLAQVYKSGVDGDEIVLFKVSGF